MYVVQKLATGPGSVGRRLVSRQFRRSHLHQSRSTRRVKRDVFCARSFL